ncbi:alpha/beta hydrolase fold protein [Pseudovibrio axinellae]|uniref:Alpha/beta hydrolase fold protein n=1 Tax=Pseudovibrio axinellae TaxID=989403 RepID=A0A165XPN2_9HYPH|nr:DUF3141 domain-containing protein [Pseudovibrio axinellae]KZL17921.1 alpha/beta hydrolase fold protein [Pseudovibrio axinellae]SER57806.1 Protein of unknown function [Pseudovibrio axinellae]
MQVELFSKRTAQYFEALAEQNKFLQVANSRRNTRLMQDFQQKQTKTKSKTQVLADSWKNYETPKDVFEAWTQYVKDSGERAILTMDALRESSDTFYDHQAKGCPPVLIYDYEVIVEGRNLPRPCNYMLLKIIPPDGVEVFDWKRPYVIIDPRAGHGAGIGGFKDDSQVGVALRGGHPVYFVAFHPMPEPEQELAHVTHAEATFLREIISRHPESPKPIVIGNCQGGWAAAILAAVYPELVGPIVLNGAPMSYWSGKMGQDPMRYSAGLSGGIVPALLSADLGNGVFDGANLVQNFEMLNPGRNWFRKYYDLYSNIDSAEKRYLDFQKWWGGYYYMTEAEFRWILDNLFIGNKLAKNEAFLEPGRPIDLKTIKSPIIVFSSFGDNITPPDQALNWIADTYTDEAEIEILGQRILYMLHEDVGHLGIFVSSSVARREHAQVASTLKTIEAMPPGLYKMQIVKKKGKGSDAKFTVSFARKTIDEMLKETDTRTDEKAFAGVARFSESMEDIYDSTVGPLLKTMTSKQVADKTRGMHPMRLANGAFASTNPFMFAPSMAAASIKQNHKPNQAKTPFHYWEDMLADSVEYGWDALKDWREAFIENSFLTFWASPAAVEYGKALSFRRPKVPMQDLHSLTSIQNALKKIEKGGVAAAIVRIVLMIADTRTEVRGEKLERFNEVLTTWAPFKSMEPKERNFLIHDQTLIARFEMEAGYNALPILLRSEKDKTYAYKALTYIIGKEDDMAPTSLGLWGSLKSMLNWN